ncbi:hypothetical protein KPH14_005738 [Odynerus spinipes]|nr:hypothetical protein KPH14_005738 [Odynerus spinipes]
MFKFIRSCTVCHNTKSLVDCSNCPNTSFCKEHQNTKTHKNLCSLFKLCFDLDVAFMKSKRIVPKVTVPLNTNKIFLPYNMQTFINSYWRETETLFKLWQYNIAYISEYLTRPLTLLFALEKLQGYENSDMIVHVIGANMMEVDGFEIWEIVLHWLPYLKSLKIVLIGPELSWGTLIQDVCNYCLQKGKNFSIDICGALYAEYECSKQFIKPNVIIGFNTGIHECIDIDSKTDTWAASIRIIAKQNCPLILTSYTFHETQQEQERLKTILRRNIPCKYSFKNPYSSLRPHRDYETEGVYYQNGYVLIYSHLNVIHKEMGKNDSKQYLN